MEENKALISTASTYDKPAIFTYFRDFAYCILCNQEVVPILRGRKKIWVRERVGKFSRDAITFYFIEMGTTFSVQHREIVRITYTFDIYDSEIIGACNRSCIFSFPRFGLISDVYR